MVSVKALRRRVRALPHPGRGREKKKGADDTRGAAKKTEGTQRGVIERRSRAEE